MAELNKENPGAGDDLTLLSATNLVALYREKVLSPVEVTRAVLNSIANQNSAVNAFCFIDEATAITDAKKSEFRWLTGEPCGAVDGVPVTIKDTNHVRGWPTRFGSRTTNAENLAREDAPAVARLREHGAVILGKTSTPEFAWKAVTDSLLNGTTHNPWNLERTPGGSSGGAAAAAALGMGALHLGGDGAGSIRIPAAFCGVYGMKATFGRVPLYPYPIHGTIIHPGPITRTVEDAALMLTVICQPDVRDWSALPYDGKNFCSDLANGVETLRVACSQDFGYSTVDTEIAEQVIKSARIFTELGAEVFDVNPPFKDPRKNFENYYNARFAFIVDAMTEGERKLLDPGLIEIAEAGRKVSAHQILQAEESRVEISAAMTEFHRSYDLLISPQLPITAFEVGIEVPKASGMTRWLDWSPFTYPFNFTGQPAACVPCGFTHEGLPVALQVVGPRYREDLVLRASHAYEKVHPFQMPRKSIETSS